MTRTFLVTVAACAAVACAPIAHADDNALLADLAAVGITAVDGTTATLVKDAMLTCQAIQQHGVAQALVDVETGTTLPPSQAMEFLAIAQADECNKPASSPAPAPKTPMRGLDPTPDITFPSPESPRTTPGPTPPPSQEVL